MGVAGGGGGADAVEGRRRAGGDYPLVGPALPCGGLGRELQPCCAQVEVIGEGCTGQAVHTVGDAFEDVAIRRDAAKRRLKLDRLFDWPAYRLLVGKIPACAAALTTGMWLG